MVSAFAIVIRTIWAKTLEFYRGLFGVKLQILGEMEKGLAFPAYAKEYQLMQERGVRPLIENEKWVPRILGVFFGGFAVAAVLLMALDS